MKKLIAFSLGFALLLPAASYAQSYALALLTQQVLISDLNKACQPTCPIERNETAAAEKKLLFTLALADLHVLRLAEFIDLVDQVLEKEWRSADFAEHLEALENASDGAELLCVKNSSDDIISGLQKFGAPSAKISIIADLYAFCQESQERLQENLAAVATGSRIGQGVARIVKAVVVGVVSAGIFFTGKSLYSWATKQPKVVPSKGQLIRQKIDAQAEEGRRRAERQQAVHTQRAVVVKPAPAAPTQVVEYIPAPLTPDEAAMANNYKLIREAHRQLKADGDVKASNHVHALLKEAAQPGFKLSEIGEDALRKLQTYYDHFHLNK